MTEMTKEELEIKMKLLEAKNRELKARITILENTIRNFGEAIGGEVLRISINCFISISFVVVTE